MPKYTQIPADTFRKLQINAGMLASAFDKTTATIKESDKLGATTGGINFTTSPEFSDFGEDIDNCPKNMKELKRLDSVEPKLAGTFVTIDTTACKRLIGACDIDTNDPTRLVPRRDLLPDDFQDLYWAGDYGATDGSYILIHLMNALNTAGFQLQSTDKAKGRFAFEFTGHFSMDAQDTVPYEIFIVNKETEVA